MTIAKDFASKAGIAFVALAMIFTMSVPASNAQQTPEDLQKMINDLLAQIEALKGGAASATASGYTWTRDLKTGATGADVMELQKFLNSDPDTRVAATGAGSAGMETSYFGPATAAAVSKFQVKYRADILSPAGLVNPTGFFGPSTRAKANAINTVTTPTPDEDEDEDTTDEDEEDTEELSGEGELDTFEMDDASDTDVQENSEDTEIGVITMEATDGDIEVDRMTFTIVGQSTPTEADPWEVFEEITLWVDGEKVAEFDSSDEDNYLDEDDGEFRFSGLELVLREDEEVEVTVAATIAGSIDGAGTDAAWKLTATEVRYFDADGVSSDDDTTDELDTGAAADFDIVAEGDGEELSFSTASSNPDATDIVVDTDSKTTGVTILEYNIEAEEGDIEINTLFVKVTTGTTSSLVIDDIALEIDGQTFDAENSASTTNTVTTFEFDIDGDITIDEGDEVTVAVVVDLLSQESATNVDRYENGTTIEADVTGTEVDLTDAEGADDLTTASSLTGSANGESHTLVAEGIVVPVDSVETTTDTQGENDTIGKYTIEFEVTAVEGDFYIAETATEGTSATTGVEFSIDGGTATSTGVLSSSADEETSGVFTVREGETETFTLTVTVDPVATGLYRVQLGNVNYTSDDDGVTATEAYTPTPAQDFRTGYETVQGS